MREMSPSAWLPWAALGAALIAIIVMRDGYLSTVAFMIIQWALLASGLNFVMGFTGYYHLGLGAFYGLGAYGAALLSIRFGMPIAVSLIVMPLLAGLVSALIGPLVLRTRDLHFAVATLALGVIVSDVTNNWVSVTGGPIGIAGIQRPGALTLGGWSLDFSTPHGMVAVASVVLLGVLGATGYLRDGAFVLTLRSIKSDDLFTRSLGYRTTIYKVAAFSIAGAISAAAGTLYAHFFQYISPEPFTFFAASFQAFVVLALGGPGTLWGPLLGSVLLTSIFELLEVDPNVKLIIYGAVLLAIMVAMPQGLAPGIASLLRRRQS
jgi:branched-chain amino acid transport system permease protein